MGLTTAHFRALSILDPDEPRPMRAMADALCRDASVAAWLVDRLEDSRRAAGATGPQRPDDAAGTAMGERMAAAGGLAGWLFGRRTYEELLATWNARGGPFKDALNNSPKYVASTTLDEPLPWPNSTLLRGDIVETVRVLRAQSGGVLAIMGSSVLIRSLMAANLIDEYLLMIHPLVLGTGRRLFPEGVQASLRLTGSVTTASGVVTATYEPARD